MGLDLIYQTIPADCALLERAKRDPEFGSLLEFFSEMALYTSAYIEHVKIGGIELEFIKEAKRLTAQYPGLETRKLFSGRRWDMVYYLISKHRRQGGAWDASHWEAKAIFGGEILNEATQTTIGSRIRYSTPAEVTQLLEKLEAISPSMLRQHWDVAAMINAGVYKMHANDNEESFQWISESFGELKAFYQLAHSHNEGILASMS